MKGCRVTELGKKNGVKETIYIYIEESLKAFKELGWIEGVSDTPKIDFLFRQIQEWFNGDGPEVDWGEGDLHSAIDELKEIKEKWKDHQ